VIKAACVAQIVNVISWLQTRKDGLLKQPSFYPFKLVSNYARGNALDVAVKASMLETKKYDAVTALDVSASYDEAKKQGAVFIVNRSLDETVETEIVWQDGKAFRVAEAWQLAGNDPKAVNTWDAPNRLVAKTIPAPAVQDGRAAIKLPPLSFTALITRES
jgi:alpha-N-arabinofuranosidase